jgi:hypothetical protein
MESPLKKKKDHPPRLRQSAKRAARVIIRPACVIKSLCEISSVTVRPLARFSHAEGMILFYTELGEASRATASFVSTCITSRGKNNASYFNARRP